MSKWVDNVIRVQGSCVSQKRSRWIVNVVLVLVLVTSVGFSTILLGSAIKENQSSVAATPATDRAPLATKGELEAQARGYELVLQREPDNRTALRGLLEIRLQQGDLKGATGVLDKLAKLNPDQTDYTVLLAQAKQQIGDKEGAAQAYRTILASRPGDMNALQGLVGLQLQEKRPEAAIGLLQETLKTVMQASQASPNSVDVTSIQLLLGQVYVSQQRYTEALTIYDEAMKANKADFRPVLAEAIVLQQLGKMQEAKPLFTTAVSLAPAQYKDQIKQMSGEAPAQATPPSSPPAEQPKAPQASPSASE